MQNALCLGVIDNDEDVVYTNIPATPVLFHYSGILKRVNDSSNTSYLIRSPFFSHNFAVADRNSLNNVDNDQPMLFNYNNDIITRFYSAKLRMKNGGSGTTK